MNLRTTALALLLGFSASCASSPGSLAEALADARAEGRPLPLVTEGAGDIAADRAYAIQRKLVARIAAEETIVGYKAAATSPGVRERLGATEPILGVLFASGERGAGDVVERSEGQALLAEVEVGFRLDAAVTEPVTAESVRDLTREVVAVVELPDSAFAGTRPPSAADVIAANACAGQFVVGERLPLSGWNGLARVAVTLDREGKLVAKGTPSDALGDPWEALAWTVNEALEQGYEVGPEHLVITGAIGRALPVREGAYRARYGDALQLRFSVR